MTFGKIYFAIPESLVGENPVHAWMRYLIERGTWDVTTDPGEDVDVVFFGACSMLSDDLLEREAFKMLFFWDIAPWRFVDPLCSEFRAETARRVEQMRKCDLVLVPSQMVFYQAQMLGVNPTLCPPGIDSRLMDSVSVEKKRMQVCTVGRLNAWHKQHHWIIRAASMIDQKPKVIMCGAGDPKPLANLAEALDVDLVIGPVSDEEKVRRIRESLCFVSASAWEGFGMGPIEAMYCGTPTLAFDAPTNREMLKEFAIFFESPSDLARKVAFLLSNEGLRNEMSRRGREYVRRTLTFERATDRLEQALNHALKEVMGKKVRGNPTPELWKEVYDSEAVRNKRYHAHRFDPRWSRYWEVPIFMRKFRGCNAENVLDVGSGAVHPVIFAMNGFNVAAFDVSDVVIRQGREMAEKEDVSKKISWRQGFAEELPYEDGTFDAVLQSELLEHVPDPEKVMAEGLRVLKRGGYLIMGVPLGKNYYDPMHLHLFTVEDMRKMAEKFSDISSVAELKTINEPRTDPSVILTVLEKVA